MVSMTLEPGYDLLISEGRIRVLALPDVDRLLTPNGIIRELRGEWCWVRSQSVSWSQRETKHA